jgi:hypothetical protein
MNNLLLNGQPDDLGHTQCKSLAARDYYEAIPGAENQNFELEENAAYNTAVLHTATIVKNAIDHDQ